MDSARQLAKKQPLAQVIVHKTDGTIQTEWTYGQDATTASPQQLAVYAYNVRP